MNLCKQRSSGSACFAYVLHELLAGDSDLLGQSSTEHHDLLVARDSSEDLLNISSHVC